SGVVPGFGSEALRFSFFAGEPLLDQVVERWRAAFPRTRVVNLYGPTETTLAKCYYEVPDPPALRIQPVGSPLPQTQALVLTSTARGEADAFARPRGRGSFILCGIGEVGEIVLRTPFRSLGYLDNPLENRARFRPNPFRPHANEANDASEANGANGANGVNGSGDANEANEANDANDANLANLANGADDLLYLSGDRGRYRLDGTLEILGRIDEQVKIRGVRIEPAEVRALLGRHDAVAESAVVFREVQPGDHRLVAYVVLRPGAVLDAEALRRHLRQELPEVMVPAAFVALDALPLTPNGKLDPRALPAPVVSGGVERALSTPVEEITAGLWAELLGLPRVGAGDNFFELGGHSLIGAQLISRLRQALGVDLPLRALFETPTVAGLAAEIERRRRGGGALERRTIASFRQDRGSPPPLSFAQERYWAGRHLEARTVASTLPMMMHLVGPLDRVCLRRALSAVVDRHELLRTSFREGTAGPVQVVHPAVPTHLPVVDLEGIGAEERMAEVRHWSILDGQLHFDYERPPLFRLTLFRCAAEEHILLSTVHHIASDAWSSSVLLGEVSALYMAFRAGRPSPLRPLPAQFQDFARWQRQISEGEAQAVTFWREHLSGAVPLDLSAGRPRPGRRTFAAGTENFLVSEELESQLEALSARYGVTLFMTLLAAFKALLHHETGRDDLVVPCSFANRNQFETEHLIGNFATGLPLRTRLSGARTFSELLQRVRDVTLLAHDHPDIFYEPVMAGMSFLEPGDRGGLTTFRILFQLVKLPVAAPVASDLGITRLEIDTGKIRLDLSLFLSQSNRLAGRFRYNRDVLDEARVAGLRDRFLKILAAAANHPDCPLAELLAGSAPGVPGTPDGEPAGGCALSADRI
ncbi:MAG: condensation domain-containing protein, partial [Acidobacteriota bacterium]|nr:condensation domain-containing protein [Acidobacteriota bacterium]